MSIPGERDKDGRRRPAGEDAAAEAAAEAVAAQAGAGVPAGMVGMSPEAAGVEPTTLAHEAARVVPAAVEIVDGKRIWHAGTLVYTTVGLGVLFCWLLWGDFAWSMKERAIAPVLPLILRKLHASDTMLAVLMGLLPAIITVVVNPIISYRSDRHRGRFGRRIPYLLWTTPVAAIAMVGVALSPAAGDLVHRSGNGGGLSADQWKLALLGGCWTIFECATIAANTVYQALINDVVPRPLLGRFFGLFRALSLIAGMIFNYWLLGKAEVHYVFLFVAIGVLYGVGFFMMCLKVKEGSYAPPPPPRQGGGLGNFYGAAGAYLKESFTRPYYLWVLLALNLSQASFIPVNQFSVYYAKHLNLDMGLYGKYIAWSYLVSLILAYPLGSLADRIHPLRAGMATLVLYAAVTAWGGMYATNTTYFAIAFIAHVILSGAFFTTTASIQQRLFPYSRFAQFASAAAMVGALTNGLLSWGLGIFLDMSGHLYQYTFTSSCVLSALALGAFAVVYGRFKMLGGTMGYVAPE